MLYVVIIILETKISNWQLLYASIFVCFYCWFQGKIRTKRNGKTKNTFKNTFALITGLSELLYIQKIYSVGTIEKSDFYGNSKSGWKPWRWVRQDFVFWGSVAGKEGTVTYPNFGG